jgi:hypothetical protein
MKTKTRSATALVAILVGLLVLASCAKPLGSLSVAELLDLGEKFLTEMNYEQAIVYFERLIEIEPKNPRGDTGLAEAYIGFGDTDRAIEALRKGLELLPDDLAIAEMLGDLLHEQEREARALEAQPILTEIAAFCSSEDYDAALDRMRADDFTKIDELSKFLNQPYIADTEYGRIGVYGVDSEEYGDCMIYFGGYNGDARDGSGLWLGCYKGNYIQNYLAKGSWSDDKPNGEMQVRDWFPDPAGNIITHTITGSVVNGLWNGDATWTSEDSSATEISPVRFDMGHWVVIEVDDGGRETLYVVSKKRVAGENYYMNGMALLNPDVSEGIIGYGDYTQGFVFFGGASNHVESSVGGPPPGYPGP